jgi:serine/threonine protein kinase
MNERILNVAALGPLTKLGQGGQGTVYLAPNVSTKFASSMVFKEYKPATLSGFDFTALSSMPALVEETLSYQDAERLISIAAWPCAIVENASGPCGFLMPSIPEEFLINIKTVKGESTTLSEFQHLLNNSSVLAARGISIDDAQRYELLRQTASSLAFLHGMGVCVGDISPKNLLFAMQPRETVYFIDCDAFRINGVSAMPQMETPDWEVPLGEETATIYSDTYKLGLLALRLLSGDQETRNINRIPHGTPNLLRQIITDTLINEPERRPLPQAWSTVLGQAVEEAESRRATRPSLTGLAEIQEPPVQVRSRPTPMPPPILVNQANPAPTAVNPTTDSKTGPWVAAGLVGAAIVGAVVVGVALNGGSKDSSSGSMSTYTSTVTARPTSEIEASTPEIRFSTPPGLYPGADTYGDTSCTNGRPIPGQPGFRAGRGSASTSCAFAVSVGEAYWARDSTPSRGTRTVIAPGTVSCQSVGAGDCSGDDFVMRCSMTGSDAWVTCTGGREAVIYIF